MEMEIIEGAKMVTTSSEATVLIKIQQAAAMEGTLMPIWQA